MPTPRIVAALALSIVVVSIAHAQKSAPKPQEVFAPYWTSEPGWVTELQLKNSLSSGSLTVTPFLRLASGQEIPLDPVTIVSNASVSVWVNEGLLVHAPKLLNQPGSYGSVVFRFVSFDAQNLHAAAILAIQGEPIGFPVKASPVRGESLQGNRPGSLEGIWWQPRSGLNDVLVVSNSSGKNITGTLSLFDSGGRRWSQALAFGPHQTRRMATDQLVRKAGMSGSYGGIKFEVPGFASALNGLHFMYDETGKASILLDLFDRDPNATLRERTGDESKQWTMRAPMLALRRPDPAVGLPAKIALQPTLFVRNTTANQVSASISLTWRGDSGKGQVELPKLDLPPFATQELQIGSMETQLGIPDDAHWALVTLTSSGMPDDLIAVASSHDGSLRHNLETRFFGGLGGYFAGGEWRADATHNQIVAVTNGGTGTTDALLTLHYENGQKKYELRQTIQPGAQMWVNLAELIRNRVADHKGNVLPADLTSVTYDVQDLTPAGHGLTESSLAVDSTWGFQAVAPPCPDCCDFNSIGFDLDPVYVLATGTDVVSINGVNSCTEDEGILTPAFTTWGTDDTGIATASYAQVHGVAPGSTTGYAEGLVAVPGECGCNEALREVTVPVYVKPTVTITASPGVPLGHSAGFSVDISSNPNGVQVTLSIGTTTGTGNATFNGGSHSTSLTGGATVPVNGNTTSSTANNLVMTATDPWGDILASASFSVVSVSISIRSGTGLTPSSGNSAAAEYESTLGTNSLGAFASDSLLLCFVGAEFVGTVSPSNYTGLVVLRRTKLDYGVWTGSTLYGEVTTASDDTSDAPLRDDNPESGGSKGSVYDLDAPQVKPQSGNVAWRARQNFSEYAVLDAATNDTPVSSALAWYSAVSCNTPDFENYALSTDVSGDNKNSTGTVKLSWNLK